MCKDTHIHGKHMETHIHGMHMDTHIHGMRRDTHIIKNLWKPWRERSRYRPAPMVKNWQRKR